MRGLRSLAPALAFVLVLLLAGCSGPSSRDPGAVPLEDGYGGLLGNVVTGGGPWQQPVHDAIVFVSPGGYMATSDEDGKFMARGVPPGHYRAHVAGEWVGEAVEFDVVEGEYQEIVLFVEHAHGDHD